MATCSVAELGADPEMRMVAGSGPLGVLDSLLTHFWRPGAGKATVVLKGRGGQFTPSPRFLAAPGPGLCLPRVVFLLLLVFCLGSGGARSF